MESSFSFLPKSSASSTENSSTRWEDLNGQWIESRMQSLNGLVPLKLLSPYCGRTRRGRQSQISYCFYCWCSFEALQVCPIIEKEMNNIDLVVIGNDTKSTKCYAKLMKSQLNLDVCKEIRQNMAAMLGKGAIRNQKKDARREADNRLVDSCQLGFLTINLKLGI